MTTAKQLFDRNIFKPLYNVGALMDIPTGSYHEGKHGEMILLGGNTTFVGSGW